MANSKEDLILKASLKLFSENGYDATRIPQIVKEAGIGAGTVYRYFQSKKDLLNKLFQKSMNQMLNSLKNNYPKNSTIKCQFNFIFTRGEEIIINNPELIYFIAKNEFDKELNRESHKSFMKLFDFLRKFILKGQKQGIFRKVDPSVLSALLYGGLTFIIDFIIHKENGNFLEKYNKENLHKIYTELQQTCWDAFVNDN